MTTWSFSNSVLATCLFLLFLSSPVAAFGSGSVSSGSLLKNFVARHGDIDNLLANLPISFAPYAAIGPTNGRRVYFGNWLRDFSQLIDTGTLEHVSEAFITLITAIFGLLEFGYATGDYEVKVDTLGAYRPEEHIGR